MVSLISIPEGPVDIHELRSQYLGKLQTEDGVMPPTLAFKNREYFITNFTPATNDCWMLTLTNADGANTRLIIKNGELISHDHKLMLSDMYRQYSPKKYYDYWIIDGHKPAPFFYENIKYEVKSFMTVPGSTDLFITAEREKGHWYTFRLGYDLKSKFTRHLTTNEKGHQHYDWVLENAEFTAETHQYF